jgi:streptogramin lyase
MKRLIVAIAIATASGAGSTAAAATLTEWQLMAGMQPTDIDIDPTTGDAWFLDPPSNSINRLSGGVVTQWPAAACPIGPMDHLAVRNVGSGLVIYFTSFFSSRICILDTTAFVLSYWNLPFPVSTPETLSLDPVGRAWFSSTATGRPALAFLDPSANFVQLWILPAFIAAPGDDIAGLEFANGELSFSVTGAVNQVCVLNNPMMLPTPTTCYPEPFAVTANPIRVNRAKQVFRIDVLGGANIARLDTVLNIWELWPTAFPANIFLSPVSVNRLPYFTDFMPGVERLETSSVCVTVLPIVPANYTLFYDSLPVAPLQVFDPPNSFLAPSMDVPLVVSNPCAITDWSSISSSGPITVNVGPGGGWVWISETGAGKIASFAP